MGDAPTQTGSSGEYPSQDSRAGTHQGTNTSGGQEAYPQAATATVMHPGYTPVVHHHQYGTAQNAFSSQLDMAGQPQVPNRMGPYNMNALANALPQANYRPTQIPPGQQRFHAPASSPGIVGQMQVPQYPGHAVINGVPAQQIYMQQQPQMAQYYAAPLSPSQQQPNLSPRPNLGLYQNQVVMNPQHPHQSPAYYYPQQYSPANQAMSSQMMSGQYLTPATSQADPRAAQAQAYDQGPDPAFSPDLRNVARSNVVRGPPRKPRQSGHAIWIGNLPPQTDLMSLVHHVCREANDLESLFLISKSNCAFANFKDEPSCAAAQQKLHDSKFQTVRLVSRLRKSTVEGVSGLTAPTGPASSLPQDALAGAESEVASQATSDTQTTVGGALLQEKPERSQKQDWPDRFFILKSLTVEDLELSVRTGIWATQSHNEETLNNAFKSVDNVYLIFSANKSGEYFGYARMVSPINADPAAAIEFAPAAQSAGDVDNLPKAIPTEATEFAPRGRIIDDSARGTIFWEAEHDDAAAAANASDEEAPASGNGSAAGEDSESVRSGGVGEASGSGSGADSASKAWGKPFKLEWLSTARLPFYRTRGLRNPWNSNREVKIARDGTELEPGVGRRLISLFNRVQSPVPQGQMTGAGGHEVGGPVGGGVHRQGGMAIVTGYPPTMRPLYHQ